MWVHPDPGPVDAGPPGPPPPAGSGTRRWRRGTSRAPRPGAGPGHRHPSPTAVRSAGGTQTSRRRPVPVPVLASNAVARPTPQGLHSSLFRRAFRRAGRERGHATSPARTTPSRCPGPSRWSGPRISFPENTSSTRGAWCSIIQPGGESFEAPPARDPVLPGHRRGKPRDGAAGGTMPAQGRRGRRGDDHHHL